MKVNSLIFINTFASFVCAYGDSDRRIGQTVHTTSGPVEGHAAQDAPTVSEYLGIPYAKPPIGNLRFAAPQPYHGGSTINGTNFVSFLQRFTKPREVGKATRVTMLTSADI
jgi:cholinesterase